MNGRFSIRDAAWLLVISSAALVLRVVMPWRIVFREGAVNFLETDAWYHFRLVEFFVQNAPHRLVLDPYAAPAGQAVPVGPLFDWLAGGAALVAGLGHPSSALVAHVTAWTPACLGLITVILIYLFLRRLAGEAAAALGGMVAATAPGHFLERTLLGFADHHALESCLSVAILALAAPTGAPPRAWKQGAALGAALIAYRLAWTNAQFLVGLLTVWLVLVLLLAPAAVRVAVAGRTGVAALVAALGAVALGTVESQGLTLHLGSLAVLGVLAAGGPAAMEWFLEGSPLRRAVTLAILLGVLGAGLAVFLASPLSSDLIGLARRFAPGSTARGVGEARPLFIAVDGTWSVRQMFEFFGWAAAVGPLMAGLLLWRGWRSRGPVELLLAVWLVVTIAATIGQNRFGYYFVPAVAVAVGYVAGPLLARLWRDASRHQRTGIAAVVVVPLLVHANMAASSASEPRGLPFEWRPAFDWLRTSTPEPFGDANAYFSSQTRRPAWSVLAWWDYGYWISATARRVPISNPTQRGAEEAAAFFVETNEVDALARLERLHARYVLVNELMPLQLQRVNELYGMFGSIVRWSGRPTTKFYETFYRKTAGTRHAIELFYPDYFRTMVVRLAVMGGEAVTPRLSSSVVSWNEEDVPGLGRVKVISSLEDFASYEDADRRMREFGGGHHAIVSRNPRATPVPLEPLRGLSRVYRTSLPGAFGVGSLLVFEARAH